MKAYNKTIFRMFKKHFTRFLSIILMVVVSVGFIAGIGSATDKIDRSLTDYYRAQNVSDLIVKSTSDNGFSDDDLTAVREIYGEKNVNKGLSMDVYLTADGEEKLTRLYFLDFDDWTVNVPELTEGKASETDTQIYAESADNQIAGYAVGTEITLDFKDILLQLAEQGGTELNDFIRNALNMLPTTTATVTVCGVVQSPLTFAKDGEPSYLNPADTPVPDTIDGLNDLITLDNILYLPFGAIPSFMQSMFPTGDLYIAMENRNLFNAFSHAYQTAVEEEKNRVEGIYDNVEFITLYDNYSFVSLHSYGEKMGAIGSVLMVAFLFVTVLVVLSNMTRLLEEERSQIACQTTLGYSARRVVFKYALFVLLGCCLGAVGAYFLNIGLAELLYYVFNYSFVMPSVSGYIPVLYFLEITLIIFCAALAATLIEGRRMTNEAPAELLRPRPPRAGRKVWLERVKFIWDRLSFKHKSTLRNVLRYRSRFLMTVVAVAVSTSLVLAGLALLDLCLFGGMSSPSIMAIALVVVVFAGLLTMVVVYTLTDINISERNRELATLMVLGYYDGEVSGYIYREVYIDTIVGIIFGYPLSLLLMQMVFKVMAFGSIGGVTWFWWLVAPAVVLCFTFIVTLLLNRKIVKIDMNESLKAIE
jgi:putative ABC transport system permease protein